MKWSSMYYLTAARDLRETIESGPLCITDLFQNKSIAYFLMSVRLWNFKDDGS